MGQCMRRQLRVGLLLALLLLAATVLLAACSSGGSSSAATTPGASGTSNLGSTPNASGTPGSQNTTPSTTAGSGPGAQAGIADLCVQPVNVSAQLPANVPAYPGAQIRVGEAVSGYSIFGLCSSDGVSAVITYYNSQLPGKGWQQLKTTTIQFVQQITASQGSNRLTVTVEPDPTQTGVTDIIIELQNS